MDHAQPTTEAVSLPVQGPHLRLRSPDEPGADFIPLRLVLQPSGAVIEVHGADMLVGRHSEADIRLPLPDVSRRHCRLQLVEGCWQVIDLNSLNGVQVNGESVLQAPLEQGDLLRIGGFTFAIDIADQGRGSGATGHILSILKTLTSLPQRRAS